MQNGNVSDPAGRAVCDLSPTPPIRHVQALYPFKGTNNDELCFRKGDVIVVTQMEDGGWWEGTLRGRTGWFPSNYVKECEPSGEVLTTPSSASSPSSSALLAPQQQLANRVQILESFVEAEKNYLQEMSQFQSDLVPPLRSQEKLNVQDLTALFGDLENLVELHRQLLNSVLAESVNAAKNETGADPNGNNEPVSAVNDSNGAVCAVGPRIGRTFLAAAADVKTAHTTYSRAHPKAVAVIDKFRDEINSHLMTATSGAGGVIVLIKKLSAPFRRLSQYPPFLHEWKGQLEDSHPDRGDSQRAAQFFRDVVAECSALRREAELELEVINGNVTEWDSSQCPPPRQLGAILKMGRAMLVWAGLSSKDGSSKADHATSAAHRFLVAFTRQLVVLSTVPAMTSFVFEGNVPFKHITTIEMGDDPESKSFHLDGPNMDRLTASFEQKSDCTLWVRLIEQQTGLAATGGGRRGSAASNTSGGSLVHPPQPPRLLPQQQQLQLQHHRRQSSLDLAEADKAAASGTFRRGGSLRGVSLGAPRKPGPFVPAPVPASGAVVVPVTVSSTPSAAVTSAAPPPVLTTFQPQPLSKVHHGSAAPTPSSTFVSVPAAPPPVPIAATAGPRRSAVSAAAQPQLRVDGPWRGGGGDGKATPQSGDGLLAEVVDVYSKLQLPVVPSSQGPFHVGLVESRPLTAVRCFEGGHAVSESSLADTVHSLVEQVQRLQRDFAALALSHQQLLAALQPCLRADPAVTTSASASAASASEAECPWDAIVRPLMMDC